MQYATPVKFTADGIVGEAAVAAGTTFNNRNAKPQQAQTLAGVSFSGFSAVALYNGAGSDGDLVATFSGAGTYPFPIPLNFNKGLYLDTTGTGTGTVWVM